MKKVTTRTATRPSKQAAGAKRVAIYARVSTADQKTLKLQLEAMRRYVRERGWTVAFEIKEVGSGADRLRIRRAEILSAVRRRQIDVIVVWKLDRWGRSLLDLIHTLQELQELGVGFVSLTEALDLTTPTGRAMAGMLGVFAEFERQLLSERIRAGLTHAKAEGVVLGRPRSAQAKLVEATALKKKKVSVSEIARRLTISRSSVRRILCLR